MLGDIANLVAALLGTVAAILTAIVAFQGDPPPTLLMKAGLIIGILGGIAWVVSAIETLRKKSR